MLKSIKLGLNFSTPKYGDIIKVANTSDEVINYIKQIWAV